MRILVLNPGSSSLKATLLEPPARRPVVASAVDWGADATEVEDPAAATRAAIEAVGSSEAIDAIGYRVVHGGERHAAPVVVDDAVTAAIDDLADLAPLHNGIAAAVIRAGRAALPALPHVAVFDTGFHATLPPAARRYPVPEAWANDWGIRRFGFHGTSVAWAVRRAAELLGRPADELRLVVAHLGSGCSVTAVDRGRSVDTSMGMTPLEGLMMGTRAGSIDPGVVIRLLEHHDLSAGEVAAALEHRSGLLGVSGRSADVRVLLAAEGDGDDRAALALELFVRRAAQGIAAASVTLDRLDGIAFTGGIGEHAAEVRARIVGRLGVLGLAPLDPAVAAPAEDARLDRGSGPAVLRIESREDLVIADAVLELVGRPGPRPGPG